MSTKIDVIDLKISDDEWVLDNRNIRLECYDVYENLRNLSKEILCKTFKAELNEIDKYDWENVLKSNRIVSIINTNNYSSWNEETLKIFKKIEKNLQIGVEIIEKNETFKEKVERKKKIDKLENVIDKIKKSNEFEAEKVIEEFVEEEFVKKNL